MAVQTSFDGTPTAARHRAIDKARLATVLDLRDRVRELEGLLTAFQTIPDCWCHEPRADKHSVRCLQVRALLRVR